MTRDKLDEILSDYRHTSKNSLKEAVLQWAADEIIGDNLEDEHKKWDCPCGNVHELTESYTQTNKFKDSHREVLRSYGWSPDE